MHADVRNKKRFFREFFGGKDAAYYFCTPIWDGLAYSIMVVRQILVLFVLVRIQVGQQKAVTDVTAF